MSAWYTTLLYVVSVHSLANNAGFILAFNYNQQIQGINQIQQSFCQALSVQSKSDRALYGFGLM